MAKLFKWEPGRQYSCKYKKFTIWFFKVCNFGFDSYILKYESNQVLPKHTDPVEHGIHYRLNIGYGRSNFYCGKIIFKVILGKLSVYFFRPDICPHSLHIYDKTTKVSFGFVKYIK